MGEISKRSMSVEVSKIYTYQGRRYEDVHLYQFCSIVESIVAIQAIHLMRIFKEKVPFSRVYIDDAGTR